MGEKQRRAQVANACVTCRQKKVKCSGEFPVCSRCATGGTHCEYDVSEQGISKMKHLRQQLAGQNQDLSSMSSVLRILQSGSESQAGEVLNLLRTGNSIEQVARYLDTAPPLREHTALGMPATTQPGNEQHFRGCLECAPLAPPMPPMLPIMQNQPSSSLSLPQNMLNSTATTSTYDTNGWKMQPQDKAAMQRALYFQDL